MALKDILQNAKYADDMVLSLPDGTTATVGEMRGMEASERRALISRQQQLEAAEQGLLQRTQSLRQAGLLDDNLEPVTTRQIKETITATTGLSEDDPLFGPILKQTKAEIAQIKADAQKEIDAVKGQMTQLAGATRQAVAGYLDDYYKATYSSTLTTLPETLRGEVKLEDAVKFATDRKLMDQAGRLDIANAIDRMTWDRRKEIERQELSKQAETIKSERQQLAQMTRPGLNGPRVTKPTSEGFSPVDDKGRTKSIDEALAAASQDDAIWESAARFVQ